MDNIRKSFFGYNKKDVHNLIYEKDQLIDTQQKDIDYLRKENQGLTDKLGTKQTQHEPQQKQTPSKPINVEQIHADKQMDLQ